LADKAMCHLYFWSAIGRKNRNPLFSIALPEFFAALPAACKLMHLRHRKWRNRHTS
jgi:hypothetical protein